ncbi:SnoaL-like domain protein [Ceratobasidium sp. AG-Ba]|nr:SnoaL-like domain protein [Ceratobasidium sp. AG-Ba]
MEAQAADLRSELASLQKEIRLLRDERDVARLLNEYVYVHDQAFSPVALEDEELDREFEGFFTEDGVVDAFGVHTSREGKADWVRSVLNGQGNIVGMQMVTSNTLIDVSDDGKTASARTSAITTIASEGQEPAQYLRAAGYYTYKLRKENGEWKISYLKW